MVQIPESSIVLKTIDGSEMTVNYKSVLTAYDSEKIQKAIIKTTKPDSQDDFLDVKRTEFEIMLTGWSLESTFNLDELKQSISSVEYTRLYETIQKVVDPKDNIKKKTN